MIHTGSRARRFTSFCDFFEEGLSSADFSTQLPGRGPHYEASAQLIGAVFLSWTVFLKAGHLG